MISFLSTIENEIYKLNKFLYDHQENSYNEIECTNYICTLLEKFDFKITKNYLDFSTAFIAQKGNTYPKICLLCEYDAIPDLGHITGHNILSSISVAAALLISKAINELGGSVVVIGCPGEYLGGTRSVMVKQGTFDDIDIVLTCHPDILTTESGSSNAIIPLNIKFLNESVLRTTNKNSYNPLDGILLTFNIINSLLKGFPHKVDINSIITNGGDTPLIIPSECEAKFYLQGLDMDIVKIVEAKLRETVIYVSKLMQLPYNISLYEPIQENLLTNKTLSRLFSHNLKENGVIDILPSRIINSGLSLGVISKVVPCIHPYISIVKDSTVKFGSTDFSNATITEFAFKQSMKAALSLAYSAIDIIETPTLLSDIKMEFFNK